jgi:hypothetical protein
MTDQIDPEDLYKAAWREPQGQPVDAVGRPCTCHPDDEPPVPCAEKFALSECKASILVERLEAFAAGCRGSMWQSRDETIRLCDEAAAALSERDKRIAELEADAIIAPAECSPDCDDHDCPYTHSPLTLRQAYENSLSRLRGAEAERDEARTVTPAPLFPKEAGMLDPKGLKAIENCLDLLDGLVAESGRAVDYGEEDSFRMGEWFAPHDFAAIAEARAYLRAAPLPGGAK